MMYSKNSNGFTLVEVLMALLIMGMLMGALFVSEESAVRAVSHFSQRLRRIWAAKNFMYESRKGEEKKEDEKETKRKEEFLKEKGLVTHLLYEQDQAKINAIKDFKDIVVQRVKIEWQQGSTHPTDELVTFAFIPKKPKKQA